ncbi:MAG TPA: ZIP family metal transporter [Gemmatimonadales bacterium]|nr:ZIP family metal transporter [Gemmatimonadales bacterium]
MTGPAAVFVYALLTALATGVGALPFAVRRALAPAALAYANAMASGLMLGASFGLVAEGTAHGGWQTIAGALLGTGFMVGAERALRGREPRFGPAQGADARRMLLVVTVMTIHSVAEGVALGVSFGAGTTLAAVITIAIAVHNVPEGLAITAVLRPRGVSLAGCAGWSVVSSLPQPLMAVPAYLFVETVAPALPYGLGFAAGAMVFMVLEELLPEAYQQARRALVASLVSVMLVAMVLFQRWL